MKPKNNFKNKLLAISIFLLLFLNFSGQAQWILQGADIDGEAAGDKAGITVCISADGLHVAYGSRFNAGAGGIARGHVRVFDWNGNAWIQKGTDIDGPMDFDQAGYAVSLSEDGLIVAIGAPLSSPFDSGKINVYEWDGTAWVQKGSELWGSESYGDFGAAVSLSADGLQMAVGAPNNDGGGLNKGEVLVFEWNGIDWVQKGLTIIGEADDDESGWNVSLSDNGNVLAVGARYNDGNGNKSGHTRIYEWNGTAWIQKGTDIDGAAALDESGYSASLNATGSIVAIGAKNNAGNGINRGHVRIFEWNGAAWIQKGLEIVGEADNDYSGQNVSLDDNGTHVVIGAPRNDDNGIEAGQTRVYEWDGTDWVQSGTDIDGESAGDNSGWYVGISGDGSRIISGAWNNDGNGVDAGHARIYELGCPGSNTFLNPVACDSYTFNGVTYTSTGTYFQNYLNAAGCDSMFTIGVLINNSNGSILTQSACNTFSLNGQTYNATGTYSQLFTNAAGCDSLLALNLTINTVSTSVTQNGPTLTANATPALYQWLTCNPYQLIAAANNQNFTATTNGDYAVAVTENGCTDTSLCFTVSGLSINYHDVMGSNVAPNPFNDKFTVYHSIHAKQILITDVYGQLIRKIILKGTIKTTVEINVAPGIYFVRVDEGLPVKVVKQ